jgi:hypothetical protein
MRYETRKPTSYKPIKSYVTDPTGAVLPVKETDRGTIMLSFGASGAKRAEMKTLKELQAMGVTPKELP